MRKETIVAVFLMMLVSCKTRAEKAAELVKHDHHVQTATIFTWLAVAAVIGIGGCVTAAIFLPLKKVWVSLAGGFAAVLAMSLVIEAAIPYMAYVALAIGLIAVAVAIWYFRKYVIATKSAVQFGCELIANPTQFELLKDTHADLQEKMGVKKIIDKTIATVRSGK